MLSQMSQLLLFVAVAGVSVHVLWSNICVDSSNSSECRHSENLKRFFHMEMENIIKMFAGQSKEASVRSYLYVSTYHTITC